MSHTKMECNASTSSEDSDYEPTLLGKISIPPPIPPSRGVTFSHHSYDSLKRGRNNMMMSSNSLYHTMRRSISMDLGPEGNVQLCRFITRHSAQLPCQVKVLKGFSALPSPLPADGIINLHFIKHSKVVFMTNSTSGDKISVPLNSVAKFSILYDPESDLDKAINGYHYNTVREMMARKPLPMVVQATHTYHGSTAQSSVEEGEILCVKGVKTFLRTKQLRVQNIKGENKHLSERCCSSFTTAPEKLSLPLSSLLKLGINLPATVVTGIVKGRDHSSVLVMEQIAGETCLIASYPAWQFNKQYYFEITSDVDIPVELEKMDLSSKQDLLTATHKLFHSFSNSAVLVVSDTRHARRGLHAELLPGSEQEGVQLVRPINIDGLPFQIPSSIPEHSIATLQSEKMSAPAEDECDDDIYCLLDTITTKSTNKSNESTLMTSKPLSHDLMRCWQDTTAGSTVSKESVPSSSESNVDIVAICVNLTSRVEELSSTYIQQLNSIQLELQSLQSIVINIQKAVQCLQPVQLPINEDHQKNRRNIAKLDCDQVNKKLFCLSISMLYILMYPDCRGAKEIRLARICGSVFESPY